MKKFLASSLALGLALSLNVAGSLPAHAFDMWQEDVEKIASNGDLQGEAGSKVQSNATDAKPGENPSNESGLQTDLEKSQSGAVADANQIASSTTKPADTSASNADASKPSTERSARLANESLATPSDLRNDSDTDSQPGSDHKPGVPLDNPILPADTMVPAGTPYARPGALPNTEGKVPHICAGKKLLYRGHVDAVYATRFSGKLRVTTVDGSAVLNKAEDACIWLAPDAKRNGEEISRSFVTNDSKLSFLGKPGTIFWLAPYENIESEGKPVWAGFGAFDPTHEKQVPTDILNDRVTLRLESADGPGQVDVYTYNVRASGLSSVTRHFSTAADGPKDYSVGVGTHAHINWAFSQPGVYKLGFSATTVKSGTYVPTTSPTAMLTWLVGDNETVGLPANISTGANTITKTTEQLLAESDVDVNAAPAEEPDNSEPPKTSAAEIKAQAERIWENKNYYPDILVSENQAKATLLNTEKGTKLDLNLFDDQGNKINGEQSSGRVAIEVPDDNLFQPIKTAGTASLFENSSGWFWRLSKHAPKGAAFSYDATKLHFDNLQEGVTISFDGVNKHREGDAVIFVEWQGKDDKLKANRLLDSRVLDTTFSFRESGTQEGDLLFAGPGLYKASVFHITKLKESVTEYNDIWNEYETYKVNSKYADLVFAVGNEAINFLRQAKYEKAKAAGENPEEPQYLETGKLPEITPDNNPNKIEDSGNDSDSANPGANPGANPAPGNETENNGGNNAENNQPVNNEPKPLPVLDAAEAKAKVAEAFGDSAKEVIDHGHIDMHLVFDANERLKKAVPGAHWNEGAKEKEYASDTFVFSVPSERWIGKVNAKVVGEEIAKIYADGLFELPHVNDGKAPWTGFSTEHIPADRVMEAYGITVSIEDLKGPEGGRIVMGAPNGLGDFAIWLDSAKPEEGHKFAVNAHAHMNTFFNKPGLYSADIVFRYINSSFAPTTVKLRTHWAVGDETIQAAKKHGQPVAPTNPETDNSAKPETENNSDNNADQTQPQDLGDPLPIDDLVAALNDKSGAADQLRSRYGNANETDSSAEAQPSTETNGEAQPEASAESNADNSANLEEKPKPEALDNEAAINDFLAGATLLNANQVNRRYLAPPVNSGRIMQSNVAADTQDSEKSESEESETATPTPSASPTNNVQIGGTRIIEDSTKVVDNQSFNIWPWILAGVAIGLFILAIGGGLIGILRAKR